MVDGVFRFERHVFSTHLLMERSLGNLVLPGRLWSFMLLLPSVWNLPFFIWQISSLPSRFRYHLPDDPFPKQPAGAYCLPLLHRPPPAPVPHRWSTTSTALPVSVCAHQTWPLRESGWPCPSVSVPVFSNCGAQTRLLSVTH